MPGDFFITFEPLEAQASPFGRQRPALAEVGGAEGGHAGGCEFAQQTKQAGTFAEETPLNRAAHQVESHCHSFSLHMIAGSELKKIRTVGLKSSGSFGGPKVLAERGIKGSGHCSSNADAID